MSKKIIVLSIVLGIIGLILFHSTFAEKAPEIQYVGPEDIVVNKETATGVAVIEEVQKFIKEDIPHTQFHVNIIESDDNFLRSPFVQKDNTYIFTQEEYNRVFGKDNNAFNYEEYKLSYNTIICQDDRLFKNPVRNFANKHGMRRAGSLISKYNVLECMEYTDLEEVERAYVRCDKENTALELYLMIRPRANFLGGTEYSEEEMESYKSMIDNMCQDVIRMVAGEKAKFTWIEK